MSRPVATAGPVDAVAVAKPRTRTGSLTKCATEKLWPLILRGPRPPRPPGDAGQGQRRPRARSAARAACAYEPKFGGLGDRREDHGACVRGREQHRLARTCSSGDCRARREPVSAGLLRAKPDEASARPPTAYGVRRRWHPGARLELAVEELVERLERAERLGDLADVELVEPDERQDRFGRVRVVILFALLDGERFEQLLHFLRLHACGQRANGSERNHGHRAVA